MAAGTLKMPKKTESKTPEPRHAVIHLKGSTEYIAWLEALHKKTHFPKATIFRLAVAEWAQNHGHDLPPEF